MKRTSKLLVLLTATMMLVGCGGSKSKQNSSSTPAPSNTPNDINVVYVKSYVSDARAEQMKIGYIESLTAAGVSVDNTKINFFSTQNSTVAAYTDEILAYNEANPSNQIDVILGANGFSNAEEESRTAFLAKYVSDEVNYSYGTHSNATNNTNRKFWYDKDKAEDQYVKGLQTYLQASWSDFTPADPVAIDRLTVMVYSTFVSTARLNEIKTGFNTYLASQSATIEHLEFVHETETSSIGDFMGKVAEYDEGHPNAKVDVLLGLKSNAAITAAGFVTDGLDYNYGDKEGADSDNATRRFWYKPYTNNAPTAETVLLQNYLKDAWTQKPDEATGDLLIGLYTKYITVARFNEMKTAFNTYLANHSLSPVGEIGYVDLGSGNVATTATNVKTYNADHSDAKLDLLLGFRADDGSKLANDGYVTVKGEGDTVLDFSYGTKSGNENDRRIWYLNVEPANDDVTNFINYCKANWLTA